MQTAIIKIDVQNRPAEKRPGSSTASSYLRYLGNDKHVIDGNPPPIWTKGLGRDAGFETAAEKMERLEFHFLKIRESDDRKVYKNAKVFARDLLVNLPNDMALKDVEKLAKSILKNHVPNGHSAAIAFHNSSRSGAQHHHLHVCITERPANLEGHLPKKYYAEIKDTVRKNFEKIGYKIREPQLEKIPSKMFLAVKTEAVRQARYDETLSPRETSVRRAELMKNAFFWKELGRENSPFESKALREICAKRGKQIENEFLDAHAVKMLVPGIKKQRKFEGLKFEKSLSEVQTLSATLQQPEKEEKRTLELREKPLERSVIERQVSETDAFGQEKKQLMESLNISEHEAHQLALQRMREFSVDDVFEEAQAVRRELNVTPKEAQKIAVQRLKDPSRWKIPEGSPIQPVQQTPKAEAPGPMQLQPTARAKREIPAKLLAKRVSLRDQPQEPRPQAQTPIAQPTSKPTEKEELGARFQQMLKEHNTSSSEIFRDAWRNSAAGKAEEKKIAELNAKREADAKATRLRFQQRQQLKKEE